jgi:hypothetical protein
MIALCNLNLFTRIFPSVSELILTLIACHPRKYEIRSARVDVDGDGSRCSDPIGSRCAVIDAVSSRLRNSVSRKGREAAHATSYAFDKSRSAARPINSQQLRRSHLQSDLCFYRQRAGQSAHSRTNSDQDGMGSTRLLSSYDAQAGRRRREGDLGIVTLVSRPTPVRQRQNGEGAGGRLRATNNWQTNAPAAAARKPSM